MKNYVRTKWLCKMEVEGLLIPSLKEDTVVNLVFTNRLYSFILSCTIPGTSQHKEFHVNGMKTQTSIKTKTVFRTGDPRHPRR